GAAGSCSTQRIARTSSSAVVRSPTPSKNATGWLFIHRNSRSVISLRCHGEFAGTCKVNTAPGTKRASGSSVYSSILKAPLRPWALTRRPTRSCVFGAASLDEAAGGAEGEEVGAGADADSSASRPLTSSDTSFSVDISVFVRHVDAHAATISEGRDEG